MPRWREWLDWERIRIVGKLAVFGVASFALAALPPFFYVLDKYNQHVIAIKSAANITGEAADPLRSQFIFKLASHDHPERIPPLSLQDAEVASKIIVQKGLPMVHTGPGKGKSTAAFGLVLRAIGYGWPIGVVQFIKGSERPVSEACVFLR